MRGSAAIILSLSGYYPRRMLGKKDGVAHDGIGHASLYISLVCLSNYLQAAYASFRSSSTFLILFCQNGIYW